MRRLLTSALAGLALTGCAAWYDPDADPSARDRTDLYIAVGLETALGTLISLEQTGALPVEGANFVEATLAYGDGACKILDDPEMTADQKRLALIVGLVEPRAAFDAAFADLVGSEIDTNTLLVVVPAINGARAAVRIALTETVDPSLYGRPCATVQTLKHSWDVQRPAV